MFKEERVCYVFASLTHLCVAQVTGYERDKKVFQALGVFGPRWAMNIISPLGH